MPHYFTYIRILNRKQTKHFIDREQTGEKGKPEKVVGGKVGKGGQEIPTSSFKINKLWGCNLQHGEYTG